ncbi:MAG: hypothetical protein LBG44_06285 [Gemmatimonadota bacterium]|nr:hypothetical protein [Gemmatimonadota bacterium]
MIQFLSMLLFDAKGPFKHKYQFEERGMTTDNQILSILIRVVVMSSAISLSIAIIARKHRTDIPPGSYGRGHPGLWKAQALNPNNYTSNGRKLLIWMYLCETVFAVAFIYALWMYHSGTYKGAT